ncbi:uncharacterized protein Dwil_GK16568 [Drosophila willistoni]|uniref:Kinesin motor domain-containing protein n=1 Tax=Drosophila willistoni TaxID=7260 RepID=B4MN37_DROWI|nr:kinesin-like protein KIF18A [Drosophila willistoni]EDW73593.1 uncharacterized protein Dwil_GK16568 [Drosophila willistoni]
MTGEKTTNIKVAVRVRPYNEREMEQNQRCIVKVMDKSTLLFDPDEEDDEFFFQGTKQHYRDITKRMNKKLSMDFDRVFDIHNTNEDLFEECTAPLVDAVLNGYNCSVFVYGATGAGKTFTMLGSDVYPGLTFLTMRDLFEKIQSQQELRKFDVGCTYLEVYNEQVMNLLTKSGPLKLREDSNGVVVSGLALTPIYSADELLRMLALGNSQRTQHPTDANAESSRSHAIFQVHIRITDRKTDTKRTVKLSMIDLAGSERAASTRGIGVRFKEGASINKSLLALGNCINKLADGLKHIPYRDSNLTRILKDSLGGNCRTLMVANVSMSSLTYEDTYNTLKYASRAKKIRSTLKQNILKSKLPTEFYVKKIDEAMAENARLQERLKILESASNTSTTMDELKSWFIRIDNTYSAVEQIQTQVIGLRSRIKTLNYRQLVEKEFEQLRKNVFQENIPRITDYISNLNTQIEKYKDELPVWRGKQEVAYRELEKLKHQIKESKHNQILYCYLRTKDRELELLKKNVNGSHYAAMSQDLADNSILLRESLMLGCEVLQQYYEHCEKSEKLTPGLQEAYERLRQKIRPKETTLNVLAKDSFANCKRVHSTGDDDDDQDEIKESIKRSKYLLDEKGLQNDGLDTESDSDQDAHKTFFKQPQSLNETRVVSSHPVSALNVTVTKPSNEAHQRIVDLLSDQNVRGNTEKIRKALLRSNTFTTQGLQRSVAAASVAKENLKYSANQVRKSPQALIAKALGGNAVLTRKPLTKEPPKVKINRAASFRLKK